jgi:hypothetical protein
MPDLLTGGGIDWCRAVVGDEVMPAGEARDVADVGRDPPGDERADAGVEAVSTDQTPARLTQCRLF